jgi:sugar/nucleoside kinase (ribokinase family)
VVVQVRLCDSLQKEVQALVSANPARVCGAGDAFAGGVFASAEVEHSFLVGNPVDRTHPAQIGSAGCAAALRHLGYMKPLTLGDFENKEFSIPSLQAA